MQHVKFLKALPGILEGSVLQVDEDSAKALIDRGDAQAYDPSNPDGEPGEQAAIQRHVRGNLAVTQVAQADLPVGPAPEAAGSGEAIETGVGAGQPVEVPGETATKPELVAYAEGKLTHDDGTPLSTAELDAKTKAELRADLGL